MEQRVWLKIQFQKQLVKFSEKYCFDSEVGYLIPENHQITCFDFEPIKQVLQKFHELNKSGQIVQVTESFKKIELFEPFTFKDMIIMHDFTSMIAISYVLQKLKTIKQQEIKLPANIAEPLCISSEYLKCQPGIISGHQYNWQMNNNGYKEDILNLSFEDLKLKWFFTVQKREQSTFFIINIMGSFYIWNIFKEIFVANYLAKNAPWWEEQIINRLDRAAVIWQKFTEQNTKLMSLSNEYFYHQLRPYLSGFNNIYFQKVDKRFTSNRANAGFDPSYQLYQALMGLNYKVFNPGFETMRLEMRTVMAKFHQYSIEQMEKINYLRDYCQQSANLSEAYNRNLIQHVKFTRLHDEFVRKYIKKFSPKIEQTPPFCYLLKKADALQQNILIVFEEEQKQ